MPSALKFIGGGLLQGIGRGLVLDGKAKRERALADLEHKRALERDEKLLEGRRGLLTQQLESDRDLAAKREAGAMGRLELNIGSREKVAGEGTTGRERIASEATASREKIASQATASREKIAGVKAEKADTSAAEKRFWDISVKTATRPGVDKDGLPTGSDTTDWNAVALDMDARNLPKLAATARRRARNDQAREDRKTALPIAEDRVEAMDDSFFGESDAKVFKQYGGSRTKALEAILREEIQKIVDTRNGGKGAVTPETRPAASAGDPYVGESQPPGFPDARRAKDGFWYVKRDGKSQRIINGGGAAR